MLAGARHNAYLENRVGSYYRARYYDSGVGRFLREDPLRFGSGDGNFYDYVGNNPARYTDPTGRLPIYGKWCGPNWTGGLKEQYDPKHAGLYKPPVDRYDTVCMHHDICYFNCRQGSPCDPEGRVNCFNNCDQIFVQEMPNHEKFWPTTLSAGINLHRIFFPDPESNATKCCNAKSPPKTTPCIGFSCLDNK
jgi:RHS repeat-associated protein